MSIIYGEREGREREREREERKRERERCPSVIFDENICMSVYIHVIYVYVFLNLYGRV